MYELNTYRHLYNLMIKCVCMCACMNIRTCNHVYVCVRMSNCMYLSYNMCVCMHVIVNSTRERKHKYKQVLIVCVNFLHSWHVIAL